MDSWHQGPHFEPRWYPVRPADAEIFRFAELGDLDGIKSLFGRKEASIYDVADSTGKTALHRALMYNHKHVARFLLDQGADANQEDREQHTPTDIAWSRIFGKLATADVREAFRTMFTHDLDYFDTRRFNILHKIVLGESREHLAFHLELNETVCIDEPDANGRTALSWAAARGDHDTASLLLNAGANPDLPAGDGRTALHWAAQADSNKTVELLVKHKASVWLSDKMGRTAMHYAAASPSADAHRYIDLLVAQGAVVDKQDNHQRTPISYAARNNRSNNIARLLAHGANPAMADNWSICPLMEVARASHHSSLRVLLEVDDRLRWYGVSRQGSTLLHVIAEHGNPETTSIIGHGRLKRLIGDVVNLSGQTAIQVVEERQDDCQELKRLFHMLFDPETDGEVLVG